MFAIIIQFKEEKTNHNHEEFQKTLNEYNKVLEGYVK